MNRQPLTLRPGWHLPAVLVMTFAVGSIFLSTVLPHAAKLRAGGQPGAAAFFAILAPAFWVLALCIFLPRTGNQSPLLVVRSLGRIPLPVRWFLAGVVGFMLLGLGALYERLSG